MQFIPPSKLIALLATSTLLHLNSSDWKWEPRRVDDTTHQNGAPCVDGRDDAGPLLAPSYFGTAGDAAAQSQWNITGESSSVLQIDYARDEGNAFETLQGRAVTTPSGNVNNLEDDEESSPSRVLLHETHAHPDTDSRQTQGMKGRMGAGGYFRQSASHAEQANRQTKELLRGASTAPDQRSAMRSKLKHSKHNRDTAGRHNPLDTSSARVFVVGLPKAGTTSLHDLFLKLGERGKQEFTPGGRQITSCHWRRGHLSVGWLIQKAHDEGLPLLAYLQECRYLSQMDVLWGEKAPGSAECVMNVWPQIQYLEELDRYYPGSKFILNTRNITDHVRSIRNWKNMRDRLIANEVPGLPAGIGGAAGELENWIESHNQRVRSYFAGREEDFMEVQLGVTSAEQICKFLTADGCPMQNLTKANMNPHDEHLIRHPGDDEVMMGTLSEEI